MLTRACGVPATDEHHRLRLGAGPNWSASLHARSASSFGCAASIHAGSAAIDGCSADLQPRW
eukprot:1710441-Rhodomonas_salina.2